MNQTELPSASENAVGQLMALGKFDGEPVQFWRRYLAALAELCDSEQGCVVVRNGTKWVEVAATPASQVMPDHLTPERLDLWASQVQGRASGTLRSGDNGDSGTHFVVGSLKPDGENGQALVVLSLKPVGDAAPLEILALALGIPERYEQHRQLDATRRDASRLANALDMMALLNAHSKFASAAMELCNEFASRFGCERVSLGWLEKNYVVLKAMSHTEKIEPRIEAVQHLGALMEEACDQEEEILWPRPEGQAFITRDHEVYARAQNVSNLATLPIFGGVSAGPERDGAPHPVGAVTLERRNPFALEELRTLRLMLDQAARPLSELHRHDRWFGSRWAAETRQRCGRLLGPEHTWWKLLAIAIAVGLLVLIFGHKDYRVEGSFALKTDAMANFSAPFEGHIESVSVKPGDLVKAGATLVALDNRELLLQKEAAVAERERHSADALKAESSGDVAAMRIARAREAQAQAQMDIVNDRLARAEVKAPFDGVVVEGDLRERIAAPVQKGEMLLKIARIEDLYPVVDVLERDIQDFQEGAAGLAAFASLPGQKFAFTVERIEPVARSKEKGNLFSVRCRFTDPSQDWWRPGMSGIAKIQAGRRSLLWICTHRTVDFLRLWWW